MRIKSASAYFQNNKSFVLLKPRECLNVLLLVFGAKCKRKLKNTLLMMKDGGGGGVFDFYLYTTDFVSLFVRLS